MKLILIVATAAFAAALQAAPPSSNPLISYTLYAGYRVDTTTTPPKVTPCTPAAGDTTCTATVIAGDGLGEYSEAAGAFNCVIHRSADSPTMDATCGLRNGRSIGINFGQRVAVNPKVAQPSWATGTARGTSFLNVQHILRFDVLGDPQEYEFTTRMNVSVPSKSGEYGLRFRSETPLPDTPNAGYVAYHISPNDPYQTALVRVHHCPDTTTLAAAFSPSCPAGRKESWYVYPDPQEGGALPGTTTGLTKLVQPASRVGALITSSTKTGEVIVGQYSVPFFFKVELK